MAETNAGREERPETGSEEETSRDYSTGSEGTVGEVMATEEERIAQAIDNKGEFLSDELKKLLREIEIVQGLRAGALGEEIEARLRGVTEPSVEKLREALREEIEKLEERFSGQREKSKKETEDPTGVKDIPEDAGRRPAQDTQKKEAHKDLKDQGEFKKPSMTKRRQARKVATMVKRLKKNPEDGESQPPVEGEAVSAAGDGWDA